MQLIKEYISLLTHLDTFDSSALKFIIKLESLHNKIIRYADSLGDGIKTKKDYDVIENSILELKKIDINLYLSRTEAFLNQFKIDIYDLDHYPPFQLNYHDNIKVEMQRTKSEHYLDNPFYQNLHIDMVKLFSNCSLNDLLNKFEQRKKEFKNLFELPESHSYYDKVFISKNHQLIFFESLEKLEHDGYPGISYLAQIFFQRNFILLKTRVEFGDWMIKEKFLKKSVEETYRINKGFRTLNKCTDKGGKRASILEKSIEKYHI